MMKFRERIHFGSKVLMLVLFIAVTVFFGGCGEKVYQVGVLSGLDLFADTTGGFKSEMAKLGYIEGKNIKYDVQQGHSDPARYESILGKFVKNKVDMIVVFPGGIVSYAQKATEGTKIPILFPNSDTGALALRRFEIMHELAPKAKRMLVPYKQGYSIVPRELELLKPVMTAAGVNMVELPVNNPAEIQKDLEERAKSADIGVDAIFLIVEPLTTTPDAFSVMGKFAAEHKIPIGGAAVEAGGYSSIFGIDMNDNNTVGQKLAPFADKILKGDSSSPQTGVPTESVFTLNYKAIQELGLSVSNNLLSQANKVIR